MDRHRTRKMAFPPVLKLLLRGYIIMAFIMGMYVFGIVTHIPLVIFLISTISISMVFGVGYLLVMGNRPVRSSSFTIPNTVLFFVKGIMVMYFVSMLAQFNILPGRITSLLMLAIACILVFAGFASYIMEVLERSSPVRRTAMGPRPRTR